MITKPGIFYDMPTSEYFADPAPQPSLTQSIAKILLDRSPAHARLAHPRLVPPRPDDEEPEKYVVAQAIGNAAHALLIGRGKDLALGDFDNWKTKKAQEFKAEAAQQGKTPILSKHYDRAAEAVKAAREQLDAAGWSGAFRSGHGEVVIAWEEDGVWFRSLIDWVETTTLLYDLKTTGIACAPHNVGRIGVDAGWDIQAAMHERGLNVIDPANIGRRHFRFPAIENEEPYALVPVELSESWMVMGRKKLDVAIRIWRQCITAGKWPRYPALPITPEYPGFKETQWLDREQTEFAPDLMMAG